MALIRLVHTQTTSGPLLLEDCDSGLPNEAFGIYRKVPVYLSFNYESFPGPGQDVVVDTALAGFVDLVRSDKVVLSRAGGVIAGMETAGLLTVVDVPTGALIDPAVSAATFDSTASATSAVNDGEVVITGTNFTSFDPHATTVTLTTSGPDVVLTWAAIDADGGSSVSDTSIVIAGALHAAGVAGGDVVTVAVTANAATNTPFTVTEI